MSICILNKISALEAKSQNRVESAYKSNYQKISIIAPLLREPPDGPIECRERLGGLLKYYHRKAA